MLPTHGINSMSRTVAHGHRSENISVGERHSRGLYGCLRRASSSSLISYAQLWRKMSSLAGEILKVVIPPVLVRLWCFRLEATRASAPPFLACLPRLRHLVDISFGHLSCRLSVKNDAPSACVQFRYQGSTRTITPKKHKNIDYMVHQYSYHVPYWYWCIPAAVSGINKVV